MKKLVGVKNRFQHYKLVYSTEKDNVSALEDSATSVRKREDQNV